MLPKHQGLRKGFYGTWITMVIEKGAIDMQIANYIYATSTPFLIIKYKEF